MARSDYTSTTVHTRKFHWPEVQLNVWLLVVLTGSATCLGIFSWFMVVQSQMELASPWVFPFMIAASILSLLFIVLIIVLAFQSKLIPEIIILGSFLLFVLWLTGLIGISIQLYGSVASVNANCQNYVESREYRGASINTLAWLTQINICNCWRAAFSFTLVNTVFYIWMLFMALQVRRGEY